MHNPQSLCHLPQVLIAASLLGMISATVPYWASLDEIDGTNYMHFGLWHMCVEDTCNSIHDNVVEGRNVPGGWSTCISNLGNKVIR